ncbi:MAG: anthranilate phosphoribosyltransferase [Chloroflexi bacterium]|nr:anthranilate phosphoribosyltransferase [Chloroflexota bacterium]
MVGSERSEPRQPGAQRSPVTHTPAESDIAHQALAIVARGEPLSREQSRTFMAAVLDGDVTPAQLAGVLLAIRVRTETTDELAGFVEAMRSRVLVVDAPAGAIDTCGTGGDVRGTFNISTATSVVTAAAGVPVAKHGNRAVSSQSGSSDAIAALGLTVEQTTDAAEASLRETGYAYLHAPAFHPGMRHAGPVRRELAVRTAFNLCGPMANPALVSRQLMGVPDAVSAERVANVLHAIGIERAFVVHGDGVDELPLDDSGIVREVTPEGVRTWGVRAADAGLRHAETTQLIGGDGATNAAIIRAILEGAESGPRRDVVILNAAAALVVAGRADTLPQGAELAASTIDSGAAGELLSRLQARAWIPVPEEGAP